MRYFPVANVYCAVRPTRLGRNELAVGIVLIPTYDDVAWLEQLNHLCRFFTGDFEVVRIIHDPERPLEHFYVAEHRQELRPDLIKRLLHVNPPVRCSSSEGSSSR